MNILENLRNPASYDRFTRVNCQQKHEDKCIDVVFGWKKKEGKEVSEIQALRYDKKIWTEDSARSHCKSRGGTFEPATKEDKNAKGDLEMKWYEIKSKADVSEIWLYDEIGENFWGEGIIALEFIKELNAIKSPKIYLHINSPGGNVFDGDAIFNAIKRHPSEVTAYIDGIAASIASVIALAADKVIMAENAMFMIHNPMGGLMVIGNSQQIKSESEKVVTALDKICNAMKNTYIKKTRKAESEITKMMDEESLLNAEEAMAIGFIDAIEEKMDLAACAKFIPIMEKLKFKQIDRIKNIIEETTGIKAPTLRDAERGLRDVGFSPKVAKTILARGYHDDDLRDVDALREPDPAIEPQRDVEPMKPMSWVEKLLVKAEREISSVD